MEFIWLVLFVFFLIIEIFSLSIFSLFLSFGSLFTYFFVWLGILDVKDWANQILLFAFVSLLSFFLLKNYFRRILRNSREDLAEEFIGQRVICQTEFNDRNNFSGKVEFNGSLWQAYSKEKLNVGDIAFIQQRDNVTLKITKNL